MALSVCQESSKMKVTSNQVRKFLKEGDDLVERSNKYVDLYDKNLDQSPSKERTMALVICAGLIKCMNDRIKDWVVRLEEIRRSVGKNDYAQFHLGWCSAAVEDSFMDVMRYEWYIENSRS
jgi:DNA-dependent RNA polymerase auxiliary subunit epsilon